MVKKIIDLIFPVATLPKDADKRSKVIVGFEETVKRDNSSIIKFLFATILCWIVFSAPITKSFSFYNDFILFCIFQPVALFVVSIILYIACKLTHNTHAKLCYSIIVLIGFMLGMCGFNAIVGVLDTDYSYKMYCNGQAFL